MTPNDPYAKGAEALMLVVDIVLPLLVAIVIAVLAIFLFG